MYTNVQFISMLLAVGSYYRHVYVYLKRPNITYALVSTLTAKKTSTLNYLLDFYIWASFDREYFKSDDSVNKLNK